MLFPARSLIPLGALPLLKWSYVHVVWHTTSPFFTTAFLYEHTYSNIYLFVCIALILPDLPTY
jgi:hypothetical protein